MQNENLDNKKPIYTYDAVVRWGDMDAMLHVNNTMYFRYLEEARIQWLIDTGYFGQGTQNEGPVLVHVSNTFLCPVYYPATLTIHYFLKELGRTSFTLTHQIFIKNESNTLCSQGESKVVWVNTTTKKSVILPELLRKNLVSKF